MNEKTFKDVMGGINADAFGQHGFDYIADTTDTKGNWKAITCITDCVFTTLTCHVGDDGDGIAMVAGMTIYGQFTNIVLASGSVIAYNRNTPA